MKPFPKTCPKCGVGPYRNYDENTGEWSETDRAGHYDCGSVFVGGMGLLEPYGCIKRQRDQMVASCRKLIDGLNRLTAKEFEDWNHETGPAPDGYAEALETVARIESKP